VILAGTVDETAVKYVAAVYGVVWIVTLAYVIILNAKLGRLERQLDDIAGILERRKGGSDA
jgi:CcmD family protein